MAADTGTRRRRAQRLRSETDHQIMECVPDLHNSGLIDLVRYGTIEIVVVDYQITRIYIKPSFEVKTRTPELVPT